jgi:hypothetical protein
MEEYKSYLATFNEQPPETNLPKLLIFNTCPVVIEAIKACTYAKPKDGVPAEDIAEFDGDDPIDGTRYLVDTVDRYFDESIDEFKRVQERDRLAQILNQNQDWTAFYRNARKIDSNERVISVRRFR